MRGNSVAMPSCVERWTLFGTALVPTGKSTTSACAGWKAIPGGKRCDR